MYAEEAFTRYATILRARDQALKKAIAEINSRFLPLIQESNEDALKESAHKWELVTIHYNYLKNIVNPVLQIMGIPYMPMCIDNRRTIRMDGIEFVRERLNQPFKGCSNTIIVGSIDNFYNCNNILVIQDNDQNWNIRGVFDSDDMYPDDMYMYTKISVPCLTKILDQLAEWYYAT